MAKMYISELALALSERTGIDRREALQFITAMTETIQMGIVRDRMVKIKGLGTFKIIEVDARESVNVNTGERVLIDSHSKLSFVPDANMKELVNKPFSQFETVVLKDGVTFDDIDTDDAESVASEEESVILEEEPIISEEEPVVPEEKPIVPEEKPIVPEEELVVSEEEPIVPEEEPVIPEEETIIPEEDSVASEEEPVASEEEPIVSEKPVALMETSQVESPEEEKPQEEEVEKPQEEEEETETVEEEYEEEEENHHHSHKWLWILLAVMACALCFFAGYFLGKRQSSSAATVEPVQQQPVVSPEVQTDTLTETPTDTLTTEVIEQAQAQEVQEEKVEEPEQEWKKYEEMDPRVRTGAYHIIGLDRTVVVKQGETTARIARRTLGEGMECYIEVFNGIKASTPLQPGTEIKIPALQLKRAARQKLNQRQNIE